MREPNEIAVPLKTQGMYLTLPTTVLQTMDNGAGLAPGQCKQCGHIWPRVLNEPCTTQHQLDRGAAANTSGETKETCQLFLCWVFWNKWVIMCV